VNILYLAPSPKPPVPGTDGLCTEIGYLYRAYGGSYRSLSAFRSVPPIIPVNFYGMRLAPALKKISRSGGLIHVFFPYLVDFHALRYLPGPVVFTITSGVEEDRLPTRTVPYTLVVSSDYEAEILHQRGYRDVHIIRPGIDLTRINPAPPQEPGNQFVLLAGSAPWTTGQFRAKGFDLLLELLHKNGKLRLTCLWRGAVYREWEKKVCMAGLSDRVETIRERTDVSRVLARCHCGVVLAETSDLVKSFPNALMEALAAGRPVITNRAIPMSEYIEETGCGKVLDALTLEESLPALAEMMNHYDTYQSAAGTAGRRDLDKSRMIEEYGQLYSSVRARW
jgi:glycosyltransferase involved in cell wall biosynthesis